MKQEVHKHAKLGTIHIEVRSRSRNIRIAVKKDHFLLLIPKQNMRNEGLRMLEINMDRLLSMRDKLETKIFFPELSDKEKENLMTNAKNYLPKRLEELAKEHNFTFNKVGVRFTKTRWGSCSSKQNINLSAYTMLLPSYLIDHVIVHELCHTRQMNHSALFWKEVSNIHPNWKVLRKELRNYRWNG